MSSTITVSVLAFLTAIAPGIGALWRTIRNQHKVEEVEGTVQEHTKQLDGGLEDRVARIVDERIQRVVEMEMHRAIRRIRAELGEKKA